MNTDNRDIIEIVSVGIVIAVLAVLGGAAIGRANLRQEAAKEGVGEYSVNPLTGSTRFQWKQPAQSNQVRLSEYASQLAYTSSLFQRAVENTDIMITLYKESMDRISGIEERIRKLENGQFLQPLHEFYQPIYTNQIPRFGTNGIDWLPSVTNVYLTNLYLGKWVTITNGMLHIQD